MKQVPTNADSIIGLRGLVTEEINNAAQQGKIFVGGLTWTARGQNNDKIPRDTQVVVRRIEGVKAIVEPVAGQVSADTADTAPLE